METVAIVGVGLIGGSFASALRHAGFQGSILGVSSPQTLQRALALGIVDAAASLNEACAAADLVYLSNTISRILDVIPELAPLLRQGALVTDAGSTKTEICARARMHLPSGSFLGGHPMAGKETRGVDGADPLLFRDRTYVVTPSRASDLELPNHAAFLEWLSRIGAKISVLSPEEHDHTVSFTSHLPQLASTALAQTVAENLTQPGLLRVAGPGLTEMTRLALSSHEIWADILATNRQAVSEALGCYIDKLNCIIHIIGTEDNGIAEAFHAASSLATRLRTPDCD